VDTARQRLRYPSASVVAVTLVPAAIAGLVFANTLGNGLLLDDPAALQMAAQPTVALLTHRFGLAYLTIKLDRLLWSSAWGLHLTNLLLHALCSSLAGATALRLTRSLPAALCCGVLFAVHPVHVEAVASIENRKDLLAMACTATVVLLWMARPRPTWKYLAAFVAFCLGLWAKEVAIVGVLGVLLWIEAIDARRTGLGTTRRLARGAASLLPFVAVVAVLIVMAREAIATELKHPLLSSYADVIAGSAAGVLEVGRLLVFPARLSADWPVPAAHPVAGALLVLAWALAALVSMRRAPRASVAMAWTLLTYLPVSNVVPLTPHFVAERYLYVPSFGICLLAGLALEAAPTGMGAGAWRARVAWVVAVATIGLGAARTIARNHDWHDALTLWSSALRTVPQGTGVIHGELGLALFQQGRYREAIPELRRAIELGPEKPDYDNNLGSAYLSLGQPAEAVTYLQRALARWPDDPAVHYNLGMALAHLGRREEAAMHLRRAIDERAWQNAPPWTRASLAHQGLSFEKFRAMIQRWLDANAPEAAP
jgi:Tfp pilus assembly protein PilF